MAFCTNCGANVQGAFCPQCGTPLRTAGQASPPQAAAPAAAPAPMGAPVPLAPAKRKTSPLVWVLVVVLGLFVLGGIGIVGIGYFAYHKAKNAGFDTELMQKNPAYAAAKMVVAMNPDLEEVSHDDDAGTITVRDKKTGKTSTVGFSDLKSGNFRITAEDENGKSGTLEFGALAGKLPSWVPVYPGASQEGGFNAKGDSGQGAGGTIGFTTSDSSSKVLGYYRDKAKELGLTVGMDNATGEGGALSMSNHEGSHNLMITVSSDGGKTSIGLTYEEK